jgi:hypothetical protein
MRNISWTQVLVLVLVALVVFAVGVGVLLLMSGAGRAVVGPGMMGPGGMRGTWCPWCGGTGRLGGGLFGAVLGLTFACLLPLALLALVIIAGVWLARNLADSTRQASTLACPSCGQRVEPGWRACPYCGKDLSDG